MITPLFLRAKHWQIFVPLIVVPFIAMIAFSLIIGASFAVARPEEVGDVVWVFYFFPVFILLAAGTQLLWMWNVAVNLRKYIVPNERMPRVGLFKVTFFTLIAIICFMPSYMANFFAEIGPEKIPSPGAIISFMLLMVLIYIVMLFSSLNNNYVVAKTIKMAELQRKVVFADFVGDFFFLLIFPVAIWFLQPRINAVVNNEVTKSEIKDTELLD